MTAYLLAHFAAGCCVALTVIAIGHLIGGRP